MTQEQENICKDILKRFIYKVRKSNVCQLVFHYYNDSIDVNNRLKTYPVNSPNYLESFNTERTKYQIKKKILSTKNDYWNLDETNIKIVENIFINNEEESNFLTEYIDSLWKGDLNKQEKDFEREEQEIEERNSAQLKNILKDKYNLLKEVIILILNDNSEFPYKSDKIKILLELELDVDTIYWILQTKPKLISPRGYIDKYFKERQEGIKQKKIVEYELNSTIKHITNLLKKRN